MSRHWIEASLEIANIQYYEDHLKKEMEMKPVPDEGSIPVPQKTVNVGDYADCKFCFEKNVKIGYLYGGIHPMCIECVPKVLN